jgi:hypothetical protein
MKGRKKHTFKLLFGEENCFLTVLSLTEHHAMKEYWRSGYTASGILDLGSRWR